MRKERKPKHFLHKPIFPGGFSAIKEVIAKNIQYPEEALLQKIEGSVYLRYEIDYKGIVKDAKIITSLGYGCDEEAVRLVKLLEFEVPKTRGLKVSYHKNIRIHFQLPKAKVVDPKIQVNYTISTKEKESKEDSSSSNGYTIRF